MNLINNFAEGKQKYANNRNLQREAYFRQLSTKTMEDLLSDWTDTIVNINKNKNITTKQYSDMVKKCLVYGSEKTVSIIAVTNQYSFTHSKDKDYSTTYMLLIAHLISSLKYDFTGYKMNPMDILKTKINDMSEETNAKMFKDTNKKVENMISENLKGS